MIPKRATSDEPLSVWTQTWRQARASIARAGVAFRLSFSSSVYTPQRKRNPRLSQRKRVKLAIVEDPGSRDGRPGVRRHSLSVSHPSSMTLSQLQDEGTKRTQEQLQHSHHGQSLSRSINFHRELHVPEGRPSASCRPSARQPPK